jgi:HNH/ENDO VII superfamily nuclease
LIDAGVEEPPNSAAHHIVAWDDSRAYLAQKILDNFGIDINSAANGVFLPLKRGMEGTYHPAIHTDFYYETVTNLLGLAESPGEAIETLAQIGEMLRNGNFPIRP